MLDKSSRSFRKVITKLSVMSAQQLQWLHGIIAFFGRWQFIGKTKPHSTHKRRVFILLEPYTIASCNWKWFVSSKSSPVDQYRQTCLSIYRKTSITVECVSAICWLVSRWHKSDYCACLLRQLAARVLKWQKYTQIAAAAQENLFVSFGGERFLSRNLLDISHATIRLLVRFCLRGDTHQCI